jgi:hypothetical protein
LNLRVQISRAEERQQVLQEKVSELESQITDRLTELANTRSELEAERHHSGHDLTEAKGAQQALLQDRIRPLLSDAIDALEIDPAAPGVALRRLKNIIAIIEKVDE